MLFLFRWLLRLAAICAIVVAGLIIAWRFLPPVSNPMIVRWIGHKQVERDYAPIARMSPHLIAAVVMSEDATFCQNDGVDWTSLWDVIAAAKGGMPSRGASTITMQTVKNLFLWPSRSVLRKGIEIPLSLVLDRLWPKRRILEAYLNVAQWGRGVYGAETAARIYFHRHASALTIRQSALLATSLPDPLQRDPARPDRVQILLAHRLEERMRGASPWLACLRRERNLTRRVARGQS